MNDSFWEGGHAALETAIRSEYDERFAKLQTDLEACVDAVRERALLEEIKSTKAHLRRELRRIKANLF